MLIISKLQIHIISFVVLNVVGSSPTLHPKIRLAEIQFRKGLRFSFAFYLSFSFSLSFLSWGLAFPLLGFRVSFLRGSMFPFFGFGTPFP